MLGARTQRWIKQLCLLPSNGVTGSFSDRCIMGFLGDTNREKDPLQECGRGRSKWGWCLNDEVFAEARAFITWRREEGRGQTAGRAAGTAGGEHPTVKRLSQA